MGLFSDICEALVQGATGHLSDEVGLTGRNGLLHDSSPLLRITKDSVDFLADNFSIHPKQIVGVDYNKRTNRITFDFDGGLVLTFAIERVLIEIDDWGIIGTELPSVRDMYDVLSSEDEKGPYGRLFYFMCFGDSICSSINILNKLNETGCDDVDVNFVQPLALAAFFADKATQEIPYCTEDCEDPETYESVRSTLADLYEELEVLNERFEEENEGMDDSDFDDDEREAMQNIHHSLECLRQFRCS